MWSSGLTFICTLPRIPGPEQSFINYKCIARQEEGDGWFCAVTVSGLAHKNRQYFDGEGELDRSCLVGLLDSDCSLSVVQATNPNLNNRGLCQLPRGF